MIYTKSKEWVHEQEWRVSVGKGRDADAPFEDLPFHELELDGVIAGCSTPEEDRTSVFELVGQQYPHAELLEAKKESGHFGLRIDPIAPKS